jgi:uncharacterized membrane protein
LLWDFCFLLDNSKDGVRNFYISFSLLAFSRLYSAFIFFNVVVVVIIIILLLRENEKQPAAEQT